MIHRTTVHTAQTNVCVGTLFSFMYTVHCTATTIHIWAWEKSSVHRSQGHHLFCRQTDTNKHHGCACLLASSFFTSLAHRCSSCLFLSFLFVEIRSIYTQQRTERKKERIKRRKKETMAIDLHHGRGGWTTKKGTGRANGQAHMWREGDQQQVGAPPF